jgi:hypothetical protein
MRCRRSKEGGEEVRGCWVVASETETLMSMAARGKHDRVQCSPVGKEPVAANDSHSTHDASPFRRLVPPHHKSPWPNNKPRIRLTTILLLQEQLGSRSRGSRSDFNPWAFKKNSPAQRF